MSISDEQPRTRVRLPEDPYQQQPSGRRMRWGSGASALALIALVIAAVAFSNRSGSPSSDDAGSDKPAPASGQTPSDRTVEGVAVGFSHDSAGAQSAATNYAVAYGSEAMFKTASRHRVLRAIADPAVEPALEAQLDTSFSKTAGAFGLDSDGDPPPGQQFVCRTLPVGTHLVSYSDDAATVEVWTNGIAGLAGKSSRQPVVEAWNTMTVTLKWVGDDWRWVGFTQKTGPTPVSGVQAVSSADEIAAAAKRFGGLRYAR